MDIREWKDYLFNRYHLKVKYQGEEYHFSPVLTISAGMAVHYLESPPSQPLWIHFPKQCNSAGWIAALASLNFFYKDYFDYTGDYLKNLNPKRGEMVEIYGATARFLSFLTDENGQKYAKVELRDKATTDVLLENILALKRTRRTRIDEIRAFVSRKKTVESEKSVIEETLGIDLANNRSVLKSKILVVSGAGKRNSFSRFFKDTLFSDSSLSQICGYGDNLILERGLGRYAKVISEMEAFEEEKEKATRFIKELAENNLQVQELLPGGFSENGQFHFSDDSLVKALGKIREADPENGKRWTKILSMVEGIRKQEPFTELLNLRAVIIADIELASENSETIKKILERGIGVIILSDNTFISPASTDRFDGYLQKFPDSYRYIWDKEKLAPLISERIRPVDKEFWLFCRNFFSQDITILVHDEELANKAHKILEGGKLFYQLDSFEKLRDSFREHLRPALFTLKNNIGNYNNEIETADRFFRKFLQEYEQARNMLPESLQEKINQGLDYLDQLIRHVKAGNPPKKEATLNLLSGHLLYEKQFNEFAPKEKRLNSRVNIIRELKDFRSRVIFPGFPLFEFSNRALIRAATEYYCPEIAILSTPWEAAITRSYLEKHLNAVQCGDKLPEGDLWQAFVSAGPSKTEIKIANAAGISDVGNVDEEQEKFDLEAIWAAISESTVSRFISGAGPQDNEYVVDAFTLYFPGCFSLMKDDYNVLVIGEDNNTEVQVEERKVKDLERGDKVVFWLNEQQIINKIIDSMPGREKTFRIMNSWREILLSVFSHFNNDTEEVEQHYGKVRKAISLDCNLNRGNLLRWKNDDDLMAPHPKNLKLIMAGAIPVAPPDLDEKVQKIRNAKNQHQEFKSELQKKLISVIQEKLNEIGENPSVEAEFHGIGKFTLELRILGLLSKSFEARKVRYVDTRKLIETNI
ncbi:MAG: hypothetical protein H6566_18515 [Lewinellaceae bacterium]|nr:hypothetical protein [Lewinellaceae bacterium]